MEKGLRPSIHLAISAASCSRNGAGCMATSILPVPPDISQSHSCAAGTDQRARKPGEMFSRSPALLVSPWFHFRPFPQNRCRVEIRFTFRTGHWVMHCLRAKVNAAGPLHPAEIGITGDGVEDHPSESSAAPHANSCRIFDFTSCNFASLIFPAA